MCVHACVDLVTWRGKVWKAFRRQCERCLGQQVTASESHNAAQLVLAEALRVKLNRRWLNPALTGRFGLLADYGTSDHHMIM